ncbi:hypothetical protein V8G54_036960 [Vigna mungo]|uniref:Uncharacterized protein n=1 Tax=Vigna mungo TaxID=3915 RepID=A0AAQ3MI93_VIGMU
MVEARKIQELNVNTINRTAFQFCYLSIKHKAFSHFPTLQLLTSLVVEYLSRGLSMELGFKHQLGVVCAILLLPALCSCYEYATNSRASYYNSPGGYGNPSKFVHYSLIA